MILGDFCPDYNQRRRYHHLHDKTVYTYKQDYAKIFVASGLYQEVPRYTFDHDRRPRRPGYCASAARGVRVVLKKQARDEFYPEVE